MEVEGGEPRYFNEESSEFEKIVKLIQSSRVDAAELIFEELKKSMIKRKGRWLHEDRIWPHQNGKTEKNDKNKRKLKIIDNQELYTRFVPAANDDENKPPAKETKREKYDEVFDLTKDDNDKVENKRLTVSNRNEKEEKEREKEKDQPPKKNKTESSKSKDDNYVKTEKNNKPSEENGKSDKYPANTLTDDDVELLLSFSNGDQDNVEPKMLRKRKEVKKDNPSLHKVSNGGVQKKKNSNSGQVNVSKSRGGEPLFNLKENMKQHDDPLDPNKIRQKMFYGSTQVTRRDKPRREGTLADDSKKRLEAKLKKVKAKLKKSI